MDTIRLLAAATRSKFLVLLCFLLSSVAIFVLTPEGLVTFLKPLSTFLVSGSYVLVFLIVIQWLRGGKPLFPKVSLRFARKDLPDNLLGLEKLHAYWREEIGFCPVDLQVGDIVLGLTGFPDFDQKLAEANDLCNMKVQAICPHGVVVIISKHLDTSRTFPWFVPYEKISYNLTQRMRDNSKYVQACLGDDLDDSTLVSAESAVDLYTKTGNNSQPYLRLQKSLTGYHPSDAKQSN